MIQLIIRLGLKTFLMYFSTLLVEAVAGYKDFLMTSRFYPEELLEELNQDDILTSTRDNTQQMTCPEEEYRPGNIRDLVEGVIEEDPEEEGVREEDVNESSREQIFFSTMDSLSLDGVDLKAADAGDRDSLSSETSEDRLILAHMIRAQECAGGEPYANPDQHSIHSISLIMPRHREDSPNILDDLEPFGDYDECDTAVFDQDSPLSCASSKNIHKRIRTSSGKSLEIPSEAGAKNSHVTLDSSESKNMSEFVALKNGDSRSSKTERTDASRWRLSEKTEDNNSSEDHIDSKKNGKNPQAARQRSTSDMVRSETEDLMLHLSSDSSGSVINIRDIAADSVKWLCHKLGPVLATKFLSRNLVRMLALCYLGQDQLQFVESSGKL